MTFEIVSKECYTMNWLLNSMLAYWVVLLLISLGAAAVIYFIWLKDSLI